MGCLALFPSWQTRLAGCRQPTADQTFITTLQNIAQTQYLDTDIMHVGNASRDLRVKRITPRHLQVCICLRAGRGTLPVSCMVEWSQAKTDSDVQEYTEECEFTEDVRSCMPVCSACK
jgi:hypothetical protein